MINQTLKILHVNGAPGDIELIEGELSKAGYAFNIFNVVCKCGFISSLSNGAPDVIISNFNFLSFNALDVLKITAARSLVIPIILFVAPECESDAVDTLKNGFADYVTKDRLQRLPFAVLRAVENAKLEMGRYKSFSSGLATEFLLTETEKMAGIGSLEIDLLTNGRKWSAGVDKILGFEEGEVEQSFQTFIKCVHPEDADRVRQDVDYSIKNLNAIDIEYRIITPGGVIKNIHSRLVFVADKSGYPCRANGFIRDITERRTAETRLKLANQELSGFFNTIDEVFFSRDMVTSKLIQISPACEKLYGYKQAEFLAHPELWYEIMHPEDFNSQKENFVKLAAGETVFTQYRAIHKVNGIRWCESKIIPSVDENGKLIRLDGVTRDITERKQLELIQYQNDQRFRELVENCSDIISVANTNGEIIFSSENVRHILGYEKEKFCKILLESEFVHPTDLRAQRLMFRDIIANPGRVYPFSCRLKHANGFWIWVEGTIKNLLHLEAVKGIVANYRDVSKRHNQELLIEENRAAIQGWLSKRSSILNALPPQIALLDENGFIVDVNDSWKKFGTQNGLALNANGVGSNYITISENANGNDKSEGLAVAEGIKQVISGEKTEFSMEYPCHSPIQKRWFQILVSPLTETENKGAVVLHSNITERRVAEDKLLKSEQQYRHIVETAQEGIWIIDENLVTIFVNKKMCDMLGYPAEYIIGMHNYDFKDEIGKQETLDRLAKRKHGIVETHQSFFLTKSGKNIMCEVSTNGFFSPDGEYIGTLAMVTDITERNAHEEALIKSEANLSAVIENTTDLVYSLNKDLQFTTYNERFKTTIERVYGFKVVAGLSSSGLLTGLPEKTAEKWATIYKKALAGKTFHFVNEYPNGKGKVFLSYSVNPIWKTGEVIGLSCFSRDITKQKLNEEKLIRSEANLRSIFETTDLYTILYDAELKIVSYNKNARKEAVKYFRKQLKTGSSGFDYFPKSRWPLIMETIEKVKNKEIVSYEVVYDFDNGNREWFEAKWVGIFNAKRKMVGIILTLNLITEKKLAFIEREKITADLIRRNQDLEQFTYIISHNLRVPVANIKGLVQVLGFEESIDEGFMKTLKALSSSANQLDNVIVDLNQILEVGKQVIEKKETIVFANLIEQITIELHEMLQKNKVVLNCDFNDVDHIFLIKPYLYSIFQNLIVNSVKYRRENICPIINIQTSLNAGNICISFEDNGKGIDLEQSGGQIFGLYRRFDFSVEGKGVGLFMVKKQVENLGGTITIQSRLGHGTKFLIEFTSPVSF